MTEQPMPGGPPLPPDHVPTTPDPAGPTPPIPVPDPGNPPSSPDPGPLAPNPLPPTPDDPQPGRRPEDPQPMTPGEQA